MIGWSNTSLDGWARIGRLNLTTTAIAVVTAAASMVAWVVSPGLVSSLAYVPGLTGPWTLLTWPLANQVRLFSVINLVFFWVIGHDTESFLGRNAMAKLLAGTFVVLTGLAFVLGLVGVGAVLAGIDMVAFLVFLLWIAENPRRPVFFQVPAWALGALLLGVNAAQLLAARAWGNLLGLLAGLVLVALWARQLGLLAAYAWLPVWKRRRRHLSAVPRPSASEARQARRRLADDERLDQLLGKISASGLDSLTPVERKELDQLRLRRRNR